jgi:prevent-host-death family protein
MAEQTSINQRDLRLRSKDIMDAVERGQAFTVTRDGHEIGQLIPLQRQRRFVARETFARGSQSAPEVDADRFRADLDAAFDQSLTNAYDR